MDLVSLSADLPTQSYARIVKRKADRQGNRAWLLRSQERSGYPNRMPAMIPSAHFEDDKERTTFECSIYEARCMLRLVYTWYVSYKNSLERTP